jgi:hypothetical protein
MNLYSDHVTETSYSLLGEMPVGPAKGPLFGYRLANQFVAATAEQLCLTRTQADCSELNPDEFLNLDVKANALGKSRPNNRTKLATLVGSHANRRQRPLQIIRNLFLSLCCLT